MATLVREPALSNYSVEPFSCSVTALRYCSYHPPLLSLRVSVIMNSSKEYSNFVIQTHWSASFPRTRIVASRRS